MRRAPPRPRPSGTTPVVQFYSALAVQFCAALDTVVDERNELLYRLGSPDASGEDLMSLVSQPPGMFHDARRIIADSRLTLGGWIENYSRSSNAPGATTGQHIAEWLCSYYSHLGHASVLTLDDLRGYGLNVDHMNNYPDLQEHCMTAFHAAQVAFMLTDTVKIVQCHADVPTAEL